LGGDGPGRPDLRLDPPVPHGDQVRGAPRGPVEAAQYGDGRTAALLVRVRTEAENIGLVWMPRNVVGSSSGNNGVSRASAMVIRPRCHCPLDGSST
jgi:hypothetical protein